MDHEFFMNIAIEEAMKAARIGEVPVGAVIVKDGEVIARGYNRVEIDNDATAHAELIAIKEASKKLGVWRLSGCTIYVTLEPCAMCAGAMVHSRIDKLIVGTDDYKRGCAGTVIDLLNFEPFNHKVEVKKGVLAHKCSQILSEFFENLRRSRKEL
ncbi:tRNA adenosine(34) deaminase TadA [Microaceticoccus formicicus]|uniref:tRNA adenosine(34) deaminase TadA n=1 Tax=Microaceticoccus formicicus TaxID=3118105 RepID=UPI003CD0295B|nr:tRNA adenosine(34) deaminase TadA [Peptoniphilaceae bacterium AMB_02]